MQNLKIVVGNARLANGLLFRHVYNVKVVLQNEQVAKNKREKYRQKRARFQKCTDCQNVHNVNMCLKIYLMQKYTQKFST